MNVDPHVTSSLYAPDSVPTPGSPGFNYTRTTDEHLAQLLVDAQHELDADLRTALYAEVQQDIVDNARSIAVYVPTYTMATNNIQGLRFDSEGYPVWYDAALAN